MSVLSAIFIILPLFGISFLLFFYFSNSCTRSVPLRDLSVRTEEGDMDFYEFLAKVCSDTTRQVVQETLEEVSRTSFQKGYAKCVDDMKTRSVKVAENEGPNQ